MEILAVHDVPAVPPQGEVHPRKDVLPKAWNLEIRARKLAFGLENATE